MIKLLRILKYLFKLINDSPVKTVFLLVGILYDRYHSRLLYYYGGLVHMMPVYSVFLLIFTMANIALPGTSSFVGEFLLLAGIYKTNILCEPQLSKKGLYPSISIKNKNLETRRLLDIISYCDGEHSLLDIAEKINVPAWDLYEYVDKLIQHDLIS